MWGSFKVCDVRGTILILECCCHWLLDCCAISWTSSSEFVINGLLNWLTLWRRIWPRIKMLWLGAVGFVSRNSLCTCAVDSCLKLWVGGHFSAQHDRLVTPVSTSCIKLICLSSLSVIRLYIYFDAIWFMWCIIMYFGVLLFMWCLRELWCNEFHVMLYVYLLVVKWFMWFVFAALYNVTVWVMCFIIIK